MSSKWHLEYEIKNYFDKISKNSPYGSINTQLEMHWLCVLVGLIYDEYNPELDTNAEITDRFRSHLKQFDDEIRALVFHKFLFNNSISPKNDDILKFMNTFFTPDNYSKISTEAMKEMDYYASGGFKIILQNIPVANNLNDFIIQYLKLLQKKIGD